MFEELMDCIKRDDDFNHPQTFITSREFIAILKVFHDLKD